MGISLSEDEAWSFIGESVTGIVTSLRRDGFPVSLPIWFVQLDRSVFFRTPHGSKKVQRIRNDNRASFLVESGDVWRELKAVSFVADATLVEDEALRSKVLELRSAKYKGLGSGGERTLPSASLKHYSGDSAIIRLTPAGRLVSWDNSKVRLKEQRSSDDPR